MPNPGFRPRASLFGSPVHAMLVHFPIACFVGALFSDLAYVSAPHPQWANFSEWLLAFGELVLADLGDPEILAVAVAEVEA